MSGGDIRIRLQPGFGGLAQDLARNAVSDLIRKAASVPIEAPRADSPPETNAGRFLPAVTTLPPPLPGLSHEADRRARSLTEFQQAFTDFDEPDEARRSAAPAARKSQDNTRSKTGLAQEISNEVRSTYDQPPITGAEIRPQLLPTKIAPAGGPERPAHAPIQSPQNISSAGASVPAPASGQPTLFMFAIVLAALAGGWLALRVP